MATEWFYYSGNQRLGPVGSQQLKDLAKTGRLQQTDLVWKEGMANPQPAAKLKGLFDVVPPGPPQPEVPPLPQPVAVDTVPQTKQAGLAESLKTAGTLAAKRADLARIKSVSLPGAFQKLGKSVFEGQIGRSDLTAAYAAVDDLRNQITAKVESSKNALPAQGFAQQAKAMAKATADAAQNKLLQVRLAQAITRLGQSAYERRIQVALPQQQVDDVEAVLQYLAEVEAVIEKLAGEKPGQAIKQSLTTEVPDFGRSLLSNRVIQVCLIPFCGFGLFLIFRSPLWSRRAKVYWAGGLACFMVIGAVANMADRKAMSTALIEAHSLWDSKKEAEAVDQFGVILHRYWSGLDKSDRSTLIRRVVEFDVRSGNEAGAKELLRKVVEDNVDVTFENRRANYLLQSEKAAAEEVSRSQALAVAKSAGSSSETKAPQPESSSDVHSNGLADGMEIGKTRGMQLDELATTIRKLPITEEQKREQMRENIYDFTKGYYEFVKTRDEFEALNGPNHRSTVWYRGRAEGFREGFNANCKSFQLPRK